MWYSLNMKKNCRGQNVLEYIILVAITLLTMSYFLLPYRTFHQAANSVLDGSVNQIENMVNLATFNVE